ncbi:MAG: YXWGXW repeat-containing protein [Terracidiphilus sp.]|nr:YXWGXW repeat-containing protein [Terracidiphilus sp.]
MKKIALAVLFALTLLPAVALAQVSIRIGPPPVVVERPGPPPERGFVWINGYQRWDGGRYVWVPGHYERPPHPGAHWVAHRYVHRHGGYVFVEGHWR